MPQPLSLGYSPCPNDTFMFSGLVQGHIPLSRIRWAESYREDVETLNRWALQERLDVTKLSFHALGHVLESYTMLRSGAALGRGCGPLLVTATAQGDPARWKIALPGQYTTATLLLRLFLPQHQPPLFLRFDRIIEAILTGQVDAGVLIHESRFTYQEQGLRCVQDLGAWWEETSGLPLPLGCIAARKSLPAECIQELEQALAASIRWAQEHPEEAMHSVRPHAQEMEERVLTQHIQLYINDFSLDLGEEGRTAVQELLRRGQEAGIF
jgi:1,4-dihydroxy-6-naphthoate synthase